MESDFNESLRPENIPCTLIPKVSQQQVTVLRALARLLHAANPSPACEEAPRTPPPPPQWPGSERRMRGPAAPSAPRAALSAGRADEAACQLCAPRGLASSRCCFFSPTPQPWPRPSPASCEGVRSAASAAGSLEETGPGLGCSCTPARAGHLQRPGPRPKPRGRPRLPEPRGHTPSRSAPPRILSSSPVLAQRMVLFPTLPPRAPHGRGHILIGDEGGFADFLGPIFPRTFK